VGSNPRKGTTFGCCNRFHMIPLVHSFCNEKASARGIWKSGETYMPEDIEILDAVRADRLDSYQLPVHKSLTSAGYPHCGGGSVISSDKGAVGDPVALW